MAAPDSLAIGRPFGEIWPEHASMLQSVMAEGRSICLDVRAPSGNGEGPEQDLFSICGSPARTANGAIGGVLVSLHLAECHDLHIPQNVTELKQAEESAKEVYAIIRSITESAEDMIAA